LAHNYNSAEQNPQKEINNKKISKNNNKIILASVGIAKTNFYS